MEFYGYFRSSSSYRCRIAFNLKGVAPQFRPVHLAQGQQHEDGFGALNPQRLLPVLVTEAGQVLTQSLAIVEWLEETRPTPPLLPADPDLRAAVRGFAQVIACEVHPLQNLRVLRHLRDDLGADDAAVGRWLQRWLRDGLETCEALLARRPAQRFCFGDSPGLADLCLVPQLFSARRFGVDVSDLPRVTAIDDACAEVAAFAQAHPSRQPDHEP